MEYEGYDFTKRCRSSLHMVLGDGVEVNLRVPTHGMAVFLAEWADGLVEDAKGGMGRSPIDRESYFKAAAAMLSRNKECISITPEMLDDWGFDIDDVEDVFDSIAVFLLKLGAEKN